MKAKKKVCGNCKYFKEKAGRFEMGLCINDSSNKRAKDIIIKRDKCERWESVDGKGKEM